MELLELQPVGKKNEFIRIRADDVLKQALDKAAARDVRSLADEARYLLMKQLGLIAEEHAPYGNTSVKGGGDRKKTA